MSVKSSMDDNVSQSEYTTLPITEQLVAPMERVASSSPQIRTDQSCVQNINLQTNPEDHSHSLQNLGSDFSQVINQDITVVTNLSNVRNSDQGTECKHDQSNQLVLQNVGHITNQDLFAHNDANIAWNPIPRPKSREIILGARRKFSQNSAPPVPITGHSQIEENLSRGVSESPSQEVAFEEERGRQLSDAENQNQNQRPKFDPFALDFF